MSFSKFLKNVICIGAVGMAAVFAVGLLKNNFSIGTSKKSSSAVTAYITADESCLTSDFGEFHNSTQLSYLKDSYANISSYASGSADLDQPEAITLKWNDTNKSTSGNYTVQLSADSEYKGDYVVK